MSLETDYQVDGHRLVVTVTGEYDPEAAITEFSALLLYCRARSLRQALVDYTQLGGQGFATLEVLYASGALAAYQSHLDRGGAPVSVAYLGSPTLVGAWSPGLELARAAGLDAIVTTDREEALAWLDKAHESQR